MSSPPRFSRLPDRAFGDRLAEARNLHHTQAPPPLPRPVGAGVDGGVELPRSAAPVAPIESDRTSLLAPTSSAIRQDAAWYGREKGSYMSPYDYNLAGRTARDNTTRPSQMAQPGLIPGLGAHFVTDSGLSDTTSSPTSSAANSNEPEKEMSAETMPKVEVAQPPPDVCIVAHCVLQSEF